MYCTFVMNMHDICDAYSHCRSRDRQTCLSGLRRRCELLDSERLKTVTDGKFGLNTFLESNGTIHIAAATKPFCLHKNRHYKRKV